MKVNLFHLYVILVFYSPYSFTHSLLESIKDGDDEEDIKRADFPEGFLFGASTSSYQIEGAYLEGGKSLSNWDVYTHIPGSIKHGENGDISVDHYHRYVEDIDLLHSLGVNAYRFSISWTRVLPRGRFGDVNLRGIMFYNKIIDRLLLKGIEPFVTICHYDFPQEFEDRYGSWLSPLMQEDFVHFAGICFKFFGDRVKYWITINEPNLFLTFAYIQGLYPPAHCSPPFGNCSVRNSNTEYLIAMHNMLLAHAKAAKLYHNRFQSNQGGLIGISICATYYESLDDNTVDRQAADRALAFEIAWVLDPLILGHYPPEMEQCHGNKLPMFSQEEREYLKGSLDFIGLNHYSTLYAKDCIYSNCSSEGKSAIQGYTEVTGERYGVLIGEETVMPKLYVVPRGMEEIVSYVRNRYHNKPIFITETGYPSSEQPNLQVNELLNDVKRINFHKSYLKSLARAVREGGDVRGYFIWTLMDDFEWVEGYDLRFGLYYVDPHTLHRIPKLSAEWYKNFLTNNTLHSKEAEDTTTNVVVSKLGGERRADM